MENLEKHFEYMNIIHSEILNILHEISTKILENTEQGKLLLLLLTSDFNHTLYTFIYLNTYKWITLMFKLQTLV